MKTTKKISLNLVLIILLGCVNITRADVCFLPDSEGCEMVPYEEYDGTPNYPRNCFATKEEAMSARTDSLDSYYQNGNMWCLKQSCSGYNVASMKPGLWDCQNCNVPQSLNYNKYKCSCNLDGATPRSGYTIDLERCEENPNACPSNSTTNCVPDECHKCNSISSVNPVYSGGKECLVYNTVDAHCPEGYVPDKPSSKCYSTQDMLCGEGKCYNAATTIPDCSGEGKQLSDDNGACWCSCKDGYHDDNNGSCVLNQCATGVAENTCGTGYTFASNNTSFTNTNGDTIRCGSCVLNQCTSGVAENTCNTANGYTFAANNLSFTNTDGETVKCGECTANPYGQCYASEDECITHVWGGSDPSMRAWYRSEHACIQEGNCWIGKSYVQYTSHCIDEHNSDKWFGIQKEDSQYIHLTASYFGNNHFIDSGEYHIFTHSGGSALFTIKTDHADENYTLSASPMPVGSHGESTSGDYTYGNFEFKSGYHYTLVPECTSHEDIYTAMVNCHNTVNGYAECTFTDTGYYFDNVAVKLTGNKYNSSEEGYRDIQKGKSEKIYMSVSGGTCWFGSYYSQWQATMIPSSTIFCEYKYKRGEYNNIIHVN